MVEFRPRVLAVWGSGLGAHRVVGQLMRVEAGELWCRVVIEECGIDAMGREVWEQVYEVVSRFDDPVGERRLQGISGLFAGLLVGAAGGFKDLAWPVNLADLEMERLPRRPEAEAWERGASEAEGRHEDRQDADFLQCCARELEVFGLTEVAKRLDAVARRLKGGGR